MKNNPFPVLFSDQASFAGEFRRYSKTFYKDKKRTIGGYHPLIGRLYECAEEFAIGGKAMRPYLVWLGFRLAGGFGLGKIMPICFAVELVHNFLLIHDDIIDSSSIRRGKATVHRKFEKKFGEHYGVGQAITLGDVLMMEAFLLLVSSTSFDPSERIVLGRYLDNLIGTGYGQALDLEFSFSKASTGDILKVADLKTAKYSFVGPLLLGFGLGGGNSGVGKLLEDFAKDLGIAFQLQDDFLGVFGDEKILGKSVLSDMREGKNTLLIYKTRELAVGRDAVTIDGLWGKKDATTEDLLVVRDIFAKCGAQAWCVEKMRKLANRAKNRLGQITKDEKLYQILTELCDFVVARRS